MVEVQTKLKDALARERRLVERGVDPASHSSRFREALDLAAERRKPFLSEPTDFFYPGLPHTQFFDSSSFGWARNVESQTAVIRTELEDILSSSEDEFRAYIAEHVDPKALGANLPLLGSKDWSVLFLCENGWLSPSTVDRCPVTWTTMLQAPLPRISGWGPTVMFSVLKGGARIAPHTGMINTRLICHLPLIVPPGCAFRVGNEVREWKVGELMIFDDTIEHEAWNDSDLDRVVLIFDIWRPELSEQERFELLALFSD